ncbi:MAG TPA: dihydrolipoyl dehydrogenase [Candidatus Thalassarchaeaceae archaeon]|nr:dihydrolipoyl dehydrogenase [Candidatus Thalassarchaeaceae archaeon]
MEQISCQVLVVGAGPGGYVAAIRAAQLGLDTVIVEGDRAGGTCLIRGCIPSKAIIHASERFEALKAHQTGHMGLKVEGDISLDMTALVDWKNVIVDKLNKGVEGLLKGNGARLVKGWASFLDGKTCNVTDSEGNKIAHITTENVILATGSQPIELPFMPYDEKFILSSTGALELDELPEKIAIIGGGYIGLELGCALRKLGVEITVIEGLDTVVSIFDSEIRRPLERWLKKNKVTVHTNCLAQSAEVNDSGVDLSWKNGEGEIVSESFDKVLVTVGRKANIQGWGLEEMGVKMDVSGRFVAIDSQCKTNMRGIYAIGDLVGEPLLAHKASAQGEMVAEIIAGKRRDFEPVAIPAIVFTEPEIVSVGMTPDEAEAAGENILVGKFPLAANGRSLTLEAEKTGGFVRVVARKEDHLILGIQAVGSHIAELSGAFVLALEMGALLEDIAGTIHAHPTMSEAFHEGVLKTLGHAIHSM